MSSLLKEKRTRECMTRDLKMLKKQLKIVQDCMHLKTKKEIREAVNAAVEIAENLDERLGELETDGRTIRKEINRMSEYKRRKAEGHAATEVSAMDVDQGETSPTAPIRHKKGASEKTPDGNSKKRYASSPLQEEVSQKKRAVQVPDDEKWNEVVGRRHRTRKNTMPKESKDLRRKKKTRPRNDAVKVVAENQVTYAEIIKQLNGNAELKEKAAVQAIRRTKKDELLIVLRKGEETASFAKIVGDELMGKASIKMLITMRTLEIRDIDETAEKQDIVDAIKEQLQDKTPVDIGCVLFKGYGGMQVALVSLPDAAADAIMEAGKVRVNLVNCRIRERTEVKRCLRCLGFGHMSSRCKGQDRKGCCWNCGEEGHTSKNCVKESSCVACGDRKLDTRHKPGSRNCPTFREELDKQKRRQ
jgi:hypothetical protein